MLAHHFTEHPGQFGKSYQCAGYVRTAALIPRVLPRVRHGTRDKKTAGRGLCPKDLRTQQRRPRHQLIIHRTPSGVSAKD